MLFVRRSSDEGKYNLLLHLADRAGCKIMLKRRPSTFLGGKNLVFHFVFILKGCLVEFIIQGFSNAIYFSSNRTFFFLLFFFESVYIRLKIFYTCAIMIIRRRTGLICILARFYLFVFHWSHYYVNQFFLLHHKRYNFCLRKFFHNSWCVPADFNQIEISKAKLELKNFSASLRRRHSFEGHFAAILSLFFSKFINSTSFSWFPRVYLLKPCELFEAITLRQFFIFCDSWIKKYDAGISKNP